LFLIVGYVGVVVGKEFYMQAIGYELDKVSALEMVDSPFAFCVDMSTLSEYSKPPAIISLHRLIVEDVFVEVWRDSIVYFGVSAVCMRQWKLIKRVKQLPTESCLKALK